MNVPESPPHENASEELTREEPKDPPASRRNAGRHAGTKAAPRKKKKRMSPLLRFLLKLTGVTLILWLVFSFVLGVHIHHGNRMYPFLMDGDLLITYKLDPYNVEDAVVYRNRETRQVEVSRIVAKGEGEIQISESGELLINGYIPVERVFYPTNPLDGSEIVFPYSMSPEAYFLLDDYREIGLDSRAFGEVDEDALLGKVVYVFRRRGI